MTGFKSKKALTDRMADAQKEGLHKHNEWQLVMDKLQREIEARKDENMALAMEIDRLRKALTTRFARSSGIEEQLMAVGVGKRPLPTMEECLEWAQKLGIPDEFRMGKKHG